MKSKILKSIVVITIGVAILGGIFYAKNHRGSQTSETAQTSQNSQPKDADSVKDHSVAPGSALIGADGKPIAGGAAGNGSTSLPAAVALLTSPPSGAMSGTSGSKPTTAAAPATATGALEMDKTAQLQKGPECFQVTFTSKDIESRIKDNAFVFQKNLLKLPEVPFNSSSVCVRVDGKPIRFETLKGKPSELTIAPLKNIRSVVTASYCLGESKCNESCKAPADLVVAEAKVKDEFLEAIGGDDSAELSKDYGKWNEGAKADEHNAKLEAALDPEIKRELANLDEEESKPKKAPRKIEIFSGWERSDEAPACRPTASNTKKEHSS